MTDRKNMTPEEIERRLIADADNPAAWEHLATVTPSQSPRPAWYGKPMALAGNDLPDVAFNGIRAWKSAGSRYDDLLRRKRLHDAIAELPKGQRQCLQLWLDGFTYNEISTAISVSIDDVRSSVRDATRQLRATLSEEDRGVAPRTR